MDRRLDPRVARLLPAAVDVQGRVRGAGRAGHPAQVPLSRCIMHRMLDRTRPGTVRARARSALETPWRRLLHGMLLQCCACGLCRRVPETERGGILRLDSEFQKTRVWGTHTPDARALSKHSASQDQAQACGVREQVHLRGHSDLTRESCLCLCDCVCTQRGRTRPSARPGARAS